MSEMIERVARAICDAPDDEMIDPKMKWDDTPESHRMEYRIEARAAIEAMRELTKEMYRIGDCHVNGYEDMRSLGEAWEAMIDEALK